MQSVAVAHLFERLDLIDQMELDRRHGQPHLICEDRVSVGWAGAMGEGAGFGASLGVGLVTESG